MTINNTISYIKLISDNKTQVKNVYHISDILIRSDNRSTEYERTFSELYRILLKKPEKSMLVVTGNTLYSHTFNSQTFNMVKSFYEKLSDIIDIMVIPGPRDSVLAVAPQNSGKKDLEFDDTLELIFTSLKKRNIFYIKSSGVYQYYNLVFGLTGASDEYLITADNIPGDKFKIALYHGALDDNLKSSDFMGYDFVMLGGNDNYLKIDENIAYPGSLLQQSFDDNKHGVLRWDICKKSVEFIPVKNGYGYITIEITDGQLITDISTIPKITRLLIKRLNTTEEQYQNILLQIESKTKLLEVQQKQLDNIIVRNTNYVQESIIESYLEKLGNKKSVIDKVIRLHNELYTQKTLDDDIVLNWNILELSFSNCLSYGKDNVIDFRKYRNNAVIGIFAPNQYGKTAIIDIILFCLFEKFSRSDSKDFIHKEEKNMYCSILFNVADKHYLVERTGIRSKRGDTTKVDVNLFSINGSERIDIGGMNKSETNKLITDLVGTYNDYLAMCFCLQNGNGTNFLDMTQTHKKEYLNSILKLNVTVFDSCNKIAKNKVKELSAQMKLVDQKINSQSFDKMKDCAKSLTNKIKVSQKKLARLTELISDERIEITNTLQFSELSEYTLNTQADIDKRIFELKKIISTKRSHQIVEQTTNLSADQTKLAELKTLMANHKQSILIDDLIKNKDQLTKLLVHVPTFDSNEIITLKNDLVSLKHIRLNIVVDSERISFLKAAINKEKSNLRAYNKGWEQALTAAIKQSDELNDEISHLIGTYNFDLIDKSELKIKLPVVKKHVKHLEKIRDLLTKYESGHHPVNDLIVAELVNDKTLGSYQKWIEKNENKDYDQVNIDDKIALQKKLSKRILNMQSDMLIEADNLYIQKIVSKYESELVHLSEAKEKYDKISVDIEDNQKRLSTLESHLIQSTTNAELVLQINSLVAKISEYKSKKDSIKKSIMDVKASVTDGKKFVDTYHKEIKLRETSRKQLKLLYLVKINNTFVECDKNNAIVWATINNNMRDTIGNLKMNITKDTCDIEKCKDAIREYLDMRKEYDNMAEYLEIYHIYANLTNVSGLPYEIIKTYLPLIENTVNEILIKLAYFKIEITFNEKAVIGINIVDSNSRDVKLSSGFEKFVIELAFKIALAKISVTNKPNMLVIDEGWNCLDAENIINVSKIINYLKSQYSRVIIISHIEEMKNKADYIININKIGNFSRVKTCNVVKKKTTI